ncbi:unnamed protein product [Cylindrotheca closterium]|uniref:Uncharacterized protein n=1 Tax=Cylindrotheca closterium TaxID=2856 RepID=A0AAD2CEN7_9STRA|nr:unnamed protein product [Cylindrotheca closterium]
MLQQPRILSDCQIELYHSESSQSGHNDVYKGIARLDTGPFVAGKPAGCWFNDTNVTESYLQNSFRNFFPLTWRS